MLEDAIVPAAAALGLLHGLNPTAGWLFALYRALWCKSLKELLASVSVVGLGHIAASTLIAAPIVLPFPPPSHIAPVTSAGLIAISAYRLTRPRHRYLGMEAGYPLLAAIGALFALLSRIGPLDSSASLLLLQHREVPRPGGGLRIIANYDP